jgi:hypothetical protein
MSDLGFYQRRRSEKSTEDVLSSGAMKRSSVAGFRAGVMQQWQPQRRRQTMATPGVKAAQLL